VHRLGHARPELQIQFDHDRLGRGLRYARLQQLGLGIGILYELFA